MTTQNWKRQWPHQEIITWAADCNYTLHNHYTYTYGSSGPIKIANCSFTKKIKTLHLIKIKTILWSIASIQIKRLVEYIPSRYVYVYISLAIRDSRYSQISFFPPVVRQLKKCLGLTAFKGYISLIPLERFMIRGWTRVQMQNEGRGMLNQSF